MWKVNNGEETNKKELLSSNLQNLLFRCGTRPNEWGTQWKKLSNERKEKEDRKYPSEKKEVNTKYDFLDKRV